MDTPRKIDGLDRFIVASLAFLLVDAPQWLFAAILPISWIWGVFGSIIFGFILRAIGVPIFNTRLVTRVVPLLLTECVPLLNVLSPLFVGVILAIHFHNKEIDRQEEEEGL